MRDDDSVERGSSKGDSGRDSSMKKGPRKGRRGRSGFGREMPFQMGNFMQMLPLLLAMGGGGNPIQGMAGMQLRLAMLMVEIWIDYLASMMEFLERTLERLAALGDGFQMGDEDDQDDEDW